jgi:beta-barrel assembly-enhancing protease
MKKYLIILLFLTACARNPVTGKNELSFISEQQEISIGKEHYFFLQQAQGGEYIVYEEIDTYINAVGQKLAAVSDRPHLPFEFVVLNNSVPNAWSLPGGKIAIYRGLLLELENEAELAAVLAHEIVHSAARHSAQDIERSTVMGVGLMGLATVVSGHKYEDVALGAATVGAGLTSLKFSRNAELEADAYGIKYMVAAGYDPQAAVTLQEKFLKLSEDQNPSWLSGLLATHPPSIERIEANRITAERYPPGGFLGTKEYQQNIAKLKDVEPAYQDLDKGYEALLNKHYPQALRMATSGLETEPNEPHLHNLKGKAAVKLHDYDVALDAFEKAIDLHSEYFDYYLQKGLLEKKLGNHVAAHSDLHRSVSLFPSDEGYFALGEMAENARNFPAAVAYFRMASMANTETGWNAKKKLKQMLSH